MARPLEQMTVTVRNDKTGKEERFPALHPRWKEEMKFVLYQPPPVNVEDRASLEEWKERVTFIKDDLQALLRLPHDRFWCQVVFDDTLHRCVDSYLRYAPRSHDIIFMLPEELRELHDVLHRHFFMICLRMATHKESKEDFISAEEYGTIIYENFIFDVPKLMDLCVLYGAGNGALLAKMISNVFDRQPQYMEDLNTTVPVILQVFTNIALKCGVHVESGPHSPHRLNHPGLASRSLVDMSLVDFQDLVFYLSDVANTLWAFLEVYPTGAGAFWQDDFPHRLASWYDTVIPVIQDAFRERDWSGSSIEELLRKKLHQSQLCILKIVRYIIFQNCLEPILEERSADIVEKHVEDFLHLMSSLLSERRFLAHWEALFPFGEDQDLLSQSSYSVDETRFQFIQDGVDEAVAMYRSAKRQNTAPGDRRAKTSPNRYNRNADVAEAASAADSSAANRDSDYQTEDNNAIGACAPRVTGVELESLMAAIKDLLPDLGEGFIELCLEEIGYDVEKVINAVLEEKLPPSLQSMDRNMPRRTKPPEEADETLFSQRQSVFDNDDFDVFNRDKIDTSRIHQGKRQDASARAVLDDRSHLAPLRPLYQAYGGEFRESMYDGGNDDYEDEYDDTYDTNLVGAADADSADELRRPSAVPVVLRGQSVEERPQGQRQRHPNEDCESSEEDEEEARRRRDEFVMDPAKVREAQARKQAARQVRQRGGRGHQQGQGHKQNQGPSEGRGREEGQGQGQSQSQGQGAGRYDVKGVARGQGQSSDVLRNRAYKEKNKSSRVNHNRKALSDKKHRV